MNDLTKRQIEKMTESGVSACYVDICSGSSTLRPLSRKKDLGPRFHEVIPSDEEDSDEDCDREIVFLSSESEDSEDENFRLFDEPVNKVYDLKKNTDSSAPMDELISGKFNLVYVHPDAFLLTGSSKMMLSDVYSNRVCGLVVDEASMTAAWSEDFREKDSGRIMEALELFHSKPTLVLTSNNHPTVCDGLVKKLGLHDVVKITAEIDRPNIKFLKKVRPSDEYYRDYDHLDGVLKAMVSGLRAQRTAYPLTIMYFQDVTHVGEAYSYMRSALGKDQFIGKPCPSRSIITMYHGCNDKDTRDHILDELHKPESQFRVVFCTSALDLGLDLPAVRHVIHYGAPLCISTYLQQVGRAGRDGLPATATIYYRKSEFRKRKPMKYRAPIPEHDRAMVDYCLSQDKCLRAQLLAHVGTAPPPNRELCACCDICERKCSCDNCLC